MKKLSLVMSLVAGVAILAAACAPAAPVAPPSPLIIEAHVISATGCRPTDTFARGEQPVAMAKVVDGATGEYLSDEDLTSVTWHLEGGFVLDHIYGPQPKEEPVEYYWKACGPIPEDYPLGEATWWVTAEHEDGRTARYDPPYGDAFSRFIIVEAPAE